MKNDEESLFFRYVFPSYWKSVENIEPANFVFPSIPSVPRDAIVKLNFLSFNFSYRRNTSSWLRPPFPVPVTVTVGSPPKIIQSDLS